MRMITPRTLLLTGSLVAVGMTFASCAPPPRSTGQLDFNQYSESASQLQTNAPASSESNQDPTTQKGTAMKTLQDFEKIEAKEATMSTTKGDITFELYQDKAPLTVTNFLNLAKQGFYDGIKFHRIIPGFMAQVGDPLTKDDSRKDLWGTGGPGYTIADEFDPSLKHDSEGVVSMANVGQPGTGGSQFFITFEATSWLDGKHAVFGKVTSGIDVLRKLEIGDQITKISYN
jgi:cyclophilin family peptidyl-prolyl cis-trans isomerase